MKLTLEPTLVGVAGEYFVAAELSLRGYIATITLRNSRGIDIIASSADATKSVSIQVKTNKSGSASWILSKKSEDYHSVNHFYVFVSLCKQGGRPSYHVVPSEEVACQISRGHREWKAGRKKDGSPRKDSNLRKFSDPTDAYRERWDKLGLESR